MSFSGFSEDDIRKLNNNEEKALTHKKFAMKPQTNNKPKPAKYSTTNNLDDNIELIPESAKLCETKNSNKVITILQNGDNVEMINNVQNKGSTDDKMMVNEDKLEGSCGTTKVEPQLNPKIDLKEFEAKQKLIEEQNRKRKELLEKALADRTKKTQKETQKLNEIKEEFKKLDAMLSNDVKILRKQIDLACWEFNECQKKYDKIEKEYLEMKLVLHQKQEKKEMLTEHLCAIIEKNEERKALKLNELLLKLELEPADN